MRVLASGSSRARADQRIAAVVLIGLGLSIGMMSTAAPALADTGPCDAPQGPPQYPDKFDWNGSYMLGDLGGVRKAAQDAGITLCTQYNAYVYDNAQGGLKRGVLAQGQLFSWIDIDLGKFTHLDLLNDTSLHAAMYSMQGRPITTREIGSFSAASFFEQIATNRVGAVWIERRFLDGKLSVRAGQLGVDDEFIISQTATAFINSSFGFPSWTATVLPGGGPAYPLPGPGARVKYSPTDAITLMAGAYTGDPAGRSNPVPQLANRFGTTFNLNGGTLWIAEAAYSTAYANSGVALPGTYKIGSWFETGHNFNALHLDTSGLSLAAPSSTGQAKRSSNDWGVYGIVDQTLLAGDKDGVHKLAAFLRLGASPSDRNLVDLYADAGLTFTGLIPGRPTDLIGVGMAYDRISDAARAFDRDTRAFATMAAIANPASFALSSSPMAPVRDQEVMIEALYTVNVTPWLTVDFDVQHFFHPSGHVLAASGPNLGKVVKDATVLGLNTQIKF
ncbi:porin, OprB family [Rhizobiales bacterium GAS113]|nr:porin, OprB family [Rhizobiales bacterium GAS113]